MFQIEQSIRKTSHERPSFFTNLKKWYEKSFYFRGHSNAIRSLGLIVFGHLK